MNEDKELEESIKYLMKIANEYKTYGDLDNPEFEDIEKIPKSIKTVLQALENKDKEIYKLKQSNAEKAFRINEQYIPKKKIEDVKRKYETKYKKHKEVADKQFEEVGTRDCFENDLAIRELGAIRVCEELLEDK